MTTLSATGSLRTMVSLLFLIQLVASAQLILAGSGPQRCKCTPNDPCWPVQKTWDKFNATLQGHLIHSKPPASVCYPSEPNYNLQACQALLATWFVDTTHLQDPISIDYPIWANNSCNPIYPNGTSILGVPGAGKIGCGIGRYPAYVVNATEEWHIKAALKFAAERNLRVVVKNTGHNFQGRSTGFGSLSIWTHNLQSIAYHDDFQAKSCPSKGKQMAVTVGAGVIDRQLYTFLDQYNAVAVGGSNPTVGVVGWFQGGGHGPLSQSYGMGADNLLEATVITPSGSTLTANACQNPDLFFAIRGGGASTYGVVTSATFKAFPSPQTTMHVMSIALINPQETDAWWDFMAYVHSYMIELKAAGVQGYSVIAPPGKTAQAIGTPLWAFTWAPYLFNQPNGTAEKLFAPVKARLDARPDLFTYILDIVSNPTFFKTWHDVVDSGAGEAVATGNVALGSRLLPASALSNTTVLVDTFKGLFSKNQDNTLLLGHLVANSQNRGLDIGMTPAWRDAVLHFVVTLDWADGQGDEVNRQKYRELTYEKDSYLRKLAPDSGAYINEADPYEPNWQRTFFGPNYPRLQNIKRRYDPGSLLWCRSCVGSEVFDELPSGKLCRK